MKKKPQTQTLTPKQYIKQKARSLPIVECWINSNWEEAKMASITVCRQHKQGNFTVGMFLVDLLHLGVKDTFYYFNITLSEYQKLLDTHRNREFEKTDYTLVHNIIYGAIEFTDEHGILPHPDFSLVKYILEEDTEEIEYIDIEFGLNGKPVFIG